ncbi:MAG: hypothetical protein Pars2KO_04720 [Parasphingorhabdus sp.]
MMLKALWAFAFLILAGCMTTNDAPPTNATTETPKAAKSIQAVFTTPDGHDYRSEIFYPTKAGKYPLIIFSHGNFASPDRYYKLLKPIASAGYIIAAPVHRDAEILALDPKPKPEKVWLTRNKEIAHLGGGPRLLSQLLAPVNAAIDRESTAVMGHSYGALIAQLAAGAIASDPDGAQPNRKLSGVDALIAYSPPGPLPNTIDANGWSTIVVPSLTVTGTADILPGFIDDWRLHKAGYEATPKGSRWLWVGEGVDHYFGGSFGREKPVDPKIQKLFDLALGATIQFLDRTLKNDRTSGPPVGTSDVEFVKD